MISPKLADLHLHSVYSDGTFSPEEIAERAKLKGLAAIALTDHDTIEGCPPTAAACARHGVEFISGAELTAEIQGQEVHILGYFIDVNSPGVGEYLATFQNERQNRLAEMVGRLNAHGIPVQLEAVLAIANCRSPGRPHLARALVQGGYSPNYDQAFERFLKKGMPAWVPRARMSAHSVIEFIHNSGGAAVLAHPGLYRNNEMIPALAEAGIDGIECRHSKHSASVGDTYVALARSLNLVATGGSDCHGTTKNLPLIGTVTISYEAVVELRARCRNRLEKRPPPGTGHLHRKEKDVMNP